MGHLRVAVQETWVRNSYELFKLTEEISVLCRALEVLLSTEMRYSRDRVISCLLKEIDDRNTIISKNLPPY